MHLANGRHRERLCPYSLQCCKADCLFAFLSRCLGVCVLLPVHTWMLSPSCIWFLSHLLRVTYNWVVSLLISYPLYVCLHVIDLLQIYLLFCLSNCLSEYLYYLYSLFVCLIDWLLIILFGWLSFWVSVCLSIGVTFMLCVCITSCTILRTFQYSHCHRFFESAFLLYSEHEVTAINILHNKIQAILKQFRLLKQSDTLNNHRY